MKLRVRPRPYELPPYSLTGDLLGFLRCGLQYRYTRIGRLPSTQPVQLWFGQFIHGVLEEAFRQYREARDRGEDDSPPWADDRIKAISDVVKARLSAQGLFAWNRDLEDLGDARVKAALNDLAPDLFPLIHRPEVRLTGARPLPIDLINEDCRLREADRYEVVGVIDVITHVTLRNPTLADNQIVRAVVEGLETDLPDEFEVIIDYKGTRRPPSAHAGAGPDYWSVYEWQVQTYAHLRSVHDDSLPVAGGIVLYLNELYPTSSDMVKLRRELRAGVTDVTPEAGGEAERLIAAWREGDPLPTLPLEFRLARALRLVETNPDLIEESLQRFDEIVAQIENCRGAESLSGKIIDSWKKNATDESTCTACDARTFCPENTRHDRPTLPRVRAA